MWLCVGSTNNDPAVVAQYFIGCLLAVNGKYAWSSLKFQITFSLNFAAKNNTFIIAGFPSYFKLTQEQKIQIWVQFKVHFDMELAIAFRDWIVLEL